MARPVTAEELLAEARRGLRRLTPADAAAAMAEGAVLVDIRSELQRERDGVVPGSVFFPRNVLEWRCDPASPYRDARVSDASRRLIVMCDEGYQSSLAAANLRRLGFDDAADLDGGFRAWLAAGLPVAQADGGDGGSGASGPAGAGGGSAAAGGGAASGKEPA
jgi:rhodanese-related sulfurtransferase